MTRISASDFWPCYRNKCRTLGTRKSLKSDRMWTDVAIAAARDTCRCHGLTYGLTTIKDEQPKEERLLRLDWAAFEQAVPGEDFNWHLRVAFEHENCQKRNQWHDELCKLCHVVADLRVLAAYFRRWDGFEEELQHRIDLMAERMTRVRDSEWLFIFGPRDSSQRRMRDIVWVAYSLDDQMQLLKLPDNWPFQPNRDIVTP